MSTILHPSHDPADSGSRYIHGSADIEQQRLSLLNGLINDASLREMALSPGLRVLDVGSGLGQFTRCMARAARPAGRVVGFERDERQLASAKGFAERDGEASLVDFRLGSAEAFPLTENEWGAFDLVHARYVLEHLRDPMAAVRQMVRAVRPGGRIVLADDDHDVMRVYPEPPGFHALWDAYCRAYDRLGNDPFVGRRLVHMLHEAGARPVRNTWVFVGACAGHRSFLPTCENLVEVLRGAREAVVSGGLLEERSFDRTISDLVEWTTRPDAALWYALAWAEGARPG